MCVVVRLVCNWVLVLVRVSHPLAAACQGVPSFVRWPIVCVVVRLVCNWVLVVVIYCNAGCLQWLQVYRISTLIMKGYLQAGIWIKVENKHFVSTSLFFADLPQQRMQDIIT